MPLKSLLTPIPLDEVSTLHDLVLAIAKTYPNEIALIDGKNGRKFSYKELAEKTALIGNALRKNGVKKGTVVMLSMPNLPEYIFTMIGILRTGATVSGISSQYTEDEFEYHFKDSGCQVVITFLPILEKVQAACQRSPNVKKVFVLGLSMPKGNLRPFTELYTASDREHVPSEPVNSKQDIALMPYSSGTTGRPKGVMISHYSAVSMLGILKACDLGDLIGSGVGENVVHMLPYFHIYGMMASMYNFIRGATAVVLPQFDPQLYLKTIQDYKIKKLNVVPPVLLFLTKSPLVDKYDLSSVTHVTCGAAPAGKELLEQFRAKHPYVEFVMQGYGMTECSLAVFVHIPTLVEPIPGSCGILLRNMEAKVIDVETEKELGVNQDGEILIRGPTIMRGYLGKTNETAATIDDAGWLHTGDIGHYDEKGLFYIVDRKKELIKVKAFQVAPAELEDLLFRHPAVADVAVIGIPDARSGELPRAFITKKSGTNPTEADIKSFVKGKVARYKELDGGVEFVDQIPKSASGKILRRFLRQSYSKSSNAKL